VFASDSFARTSSGGLGTAEIGGPWTVSSGATRQSVEPGAALLSLPTASSLTGSYLGSVAQTRSDVLASVALTAAPTGGGVSVYVAGRHVAVNQEYRARLRFLATGSVALGITRLAGTASETLVGSEAVLPGPAYTPGTVLQVRVRAVGVGTTQLSASAWPATGLEPATPMIATTDTTVSLQAAGGPGLSAYLSGSATASVTVRISRLDAVVVA
jgi:hypothetical protein